MPLTTGAIYLFGQILTFALPVGLLLCFAAFFYKQGKRAHEAPPKATTTPSSATAGSVGTPATTTATTPAPDLPPAPGF